MENIYFVEERLAVGNRGIEMNFLPRLLSIRNIALHDGNPIGKYHPYKLCFDF